jgi:hypothetical protein
VGLRSGEGELMAKRQSFFPFPPNEDLRALAEATSRAAQRGMIGRTKAIYKLFGPPRGMLFSGILSADAYFEMINSYFLGLYVSTIYSAHTLIESALSFGYILQGEDAVAEGGLGKLINVSLQRGHLSKALFKRLNELKEMRVAYTHSHVGMNRRGAMKRYMDKKAYGRDLHAQDAVEALKIVHEFLAETSPGFFRKPEVMQPRQKKTCLAR